MALRERLQQRRGPIRSPAQVLKEIRSRAKFFGGQSEVQAQHPYQVVLAQSSQSGHLSPALHLGIMRLRLQIPAQLRLARWQVRRALQQVEETGLRFVRSRGRTRRLARRVLPLMALFAATAACSLVSKDGKNGADTLAVHPTLPELSKPKLAESHPERKDAPWTYILPVDYGVRADRSGQGHFRAPRFHGEHNGLDLLAPVGTPVFSPCEGKAMAGVSRSFGRWLHVICPVPDSYTKKGGPHPWVSFFYAHLHKTDLPHNKWVSVQGAQAVGQVGKTGNARGPNVQPHLHLELIVQRNRRAAMDERHLGKDQSSVKAAEHFADSLAAECMDPFGFKPKSQLLRRARRVDPFVALTCLSARKPDFIKPPSPLSDASRAWTQYYEAKNFNVNLGVEDSRVAKR